MARSTTFLRTLLTATFLIAAGAGCSKNIDQGPAANPDTNSGPDAGRSGAQRMYAASAMAADATQPDLARGKLLATQVCGQCHGADGNSPTAAFPRLASQHQEYLVKQLNDFKVPRGDRVSARNNPIMAGITASLSEQDARNVAAYLALQPAKPGVAPNAADVTLGEKIYRMGIADRGIPACTSCHGPTGQGMATQYPRLSGQWADYVAAQLKAFQQPDGRRNNEQMQQIASRLSDEEIKAMAHYIAGLH